MIQYVQAVNRQYKERLYKFREDYKYLMEQIKDYESQFEPFLYTYGDKELISTYINDREILCNSITFAYKELCKECYNTHTQIAEVVDRVYQRIVNNSSISDNDWEDL